MCWEATLAAFGVTGISTRERNGSMMTGDTVCYLRMAGYTVTHVMLPLWGDADERHSPWETRSPSLAQFLAEHPEGDWLVGTGGHIMALRDGRLTDTDLPATGRRRVRVVYRVERAGAKVVAA